MMRSAQTSPAVGVTRARIRARGAFTLIEILVVVGLISILAAGIGLSLADTGGNSLATAQKIVATMIGSARAQAAVHQTETVLAIYGTRPPTGEAEKYLRLLQVFRNDNPGGQARWIPVGSPVSLPRGVHVVPNTTTGLLAPGVTWPSNPPLVSTLPRTINLGQQTGTPFGGAATALIIEFSADGTIAQVGNTPHARLVVATTTNGANNVPLFNNREAVRGVLLRPTGAVTFVNEALGF